MDRIRAMPRLLCRSVARSLGSATYHEVRPEVKRVRSEPLVKNSCIKTDIQVRTACRFDIHLDSQLRVYVGVKWISALARTVREKRSYESRRRSSRQAGKSYCSESGSPAMVFSSVLSLCRGRGAAYSLMCSDGRKTSAKPGRSNSFSPRAPALARSSTNRALRRLERRWRDRDRGVEAILLPKISELDGFRASRLATTFFQCDRACGDRF